MAQRVGRGIAILFHDGGTRRGEWSAARPGRTLPAGKTRYPFYRRLGSNKLCECQNENRKALMWFMFPFVFRDFFS